MSVTFIQPDGLHILAQATLSQLATDETLLNFANGLIPLALTHLTSIELSPLQADSSLAEVLHFPGPQIYPLLTALLALDAEINMEVADEQRVLPIPAFLAYRSRLPLAHFPLDVLRLPPLDSAGRYHLLVTEEGYCFAVRLDLNRILNIAGHMRIAVSSAAQPPIRLQATERRLEWQILTEPLVEAAVLASSEDLLTPLPELEQLRLAELLKQLLL